jgi:hypothetical protein
MFIQGLGGSRRKVHSVNSSLFKDNENLRLTVNSCGNSRRDPAA